MLHNKAILRDARCPICDNSEEYIEHAHFSCDHVRASRFGSKLGMLSHSISPVSIREWWILLLEFCDKMAPSFQSQTKSRALALWPTLWKSRNDFIYRGTKIQPVLTINIARSIVDKCIGESEKTCHCPSSLGHDFRMKIPTDKPLFPQTRPLGPRTEKQALALLFGLMFIGFVQGHAMGSMSLLLKKSRHGLF